MKVFLRIIAVLLVLGMLACGGWYWYDNNVDRSGWKVQGSQTQYLDFHGKPITGWLTLDGSTYYLGQDTYRVTLWQEIDGRQLFFDPDGKQHFGWLEENGSRFYLSQSGEPVDGWQTIDDQFYYFENYVLVSGWKNLEEGTYYFREDGTLHTGWLEEDGSQYYFDEQGRMVTGLYALDEETYLFGEDGQLQHGWIQLEDGQFYFDDAGNMVTGWQEIDGKTYYFDDNGAMHIGWLWQGEYRYYFQEDGTMAVSPTVIDGQTCYFSPKGIYVLLVNYANPVPSGYDPDLVTVGSYARVSRVAQEPLERMIADCKATGINCWLNCGFRSQAEQTQILEERTDEYVEKGMPFASARAKALETVAVPGYSEHQIGLAMDIVCSALTDWLIDNCWDYGFILRYPEEKADITHISYEFWHFRYVGTEVSLDMKDSGLCLEEYLGAA